VKEETEPLARDQGFTFFFQVFRHTAFDCSFVIRSRNFPHRNNSNPDEIQIERLGRPLNAAFSFRVIKV